MIIVYTQKYHLLYKKYILAKKRTEKKDALYAAAGLEPNLQNYVTAL